MSTPVTEQVKKPKVDTLSITDLASMSSVAAAILNSDKSLQDALNRIIAEDIKDAGRQAQIIMGTSWYKVNTDQSRLFQQAKASDPATFAKDLQDNTVLLIRKWAKNGLQLDPAKAVEYAENLMRGSVIKDGKIFIYDQKYINKMMSEAINFEKSRTLKNGTVVYDFDGQLATAAESLYKLANSYGYKSSVSNTGFKNWFESSLKGLVSGDVNPEDIDDELRRQAMSAFPSLTNQIMAGKNLREAADPWINAIANELELNPEDIDFNDDILQRTLNVQDESGNFKPASLRDTKIAARRDKRWQYTSKAKEEYTNIGSTLLKSFGFLG